MEILSREIGGFVKIKCKYDGLSIAGVRIGLNVEVDHWPIEAELTPWQFNWERPADLLFDYLKVKFNPVEYAVIMDSIAKDLQQQWLDGQERNVR